MNSIHVYNETKKKMRMIMMTCADTNKGIAYAKGNQCMLSLNLEFKLAFNKCFTRFEKSKFI